MVQILTTPLEQRSWMLKKIGLIITAFLLVSGCAGQSPAVITPTPTPTPKPTPQGVKPIEVISTEFIPYGTKDKFVAAIYKVKNPNQNYCLQYTGYEAVITDSAGQEIAFRLSSIPLIAPGATQYLIEPFIMVNENQLTKVAKAEIRFKNPKWVPLTQADLPTLSISEKLFDGGVLKGKFVKHGTQPMANATAVLILRDGGGKAIAANSIPLNCCYSEPLKDNQVQAFTIGVTFFQKPLDNAAQIEAEVYPVLQDTPETPVNTPANSPS